MHIVVFPGWYPSKVDRLSGDFIQRHMFAISGYCRVSVVFPVKTNTIDKEETVTIEKGNLTELYYYYPSFPSIKWLDSLVSFIRYNYLCIKAIKSLSAIEKVSLVNLYVLQKNHFLGFWVKWFYKIPYVISEQSTMYIDGRFEKLNQLQKKIFRSVFEKSASFHAVSKYLAAALKVTLQLHKEAVVIPNVVDSSLFYYNNHLTNDRITFVHVSNMTYQKNVEGMLHAFAEVKKVTNNFHLNLVGPLPASINSLVEELGLLQNTIIWNERSYSEVAEIMQQSDVFVLFTRHETFGCVIIEAHACGLPVIVSDLEVTRELISENFNGVFVETENVKDLSEKIMFLINHLQNFDPLAISLQTRNKFNYERTGKQFYDWFTSIVAKSV